MEWTFEQCEEAAKELLKNCRNYHWAIDNLRKAEAKGERIAHRREKWLKLIASKQRPFFEFQDAGGLRFIGEFRDRYSRHAAVHPNDETALADLIVGELKEKPGAFIDVGTNVGMVTAQVARACPDRRIWALEPDPNTARRAAATIALNRLHNVTLVQAAASDSDGSISFFSDSGKSESASIIPQRGKRVSEIVVEGVKVDSLPVGGPVSVIKFDVEGHEPAAVRGALETINRDRPTVIYEYHWGIAPTLGWTAEDIADLIGEGYEFEVWSGDTSKLLPATREMGTVLNIIARAL